MIGERIAHYVLVDLIGEGGMGVVYRADDPRLQRTVAIKLLRSGSTSDAKARARFLNEARAASALDHRNVCTIHDIGETDDGRMYMVMPFYEGESLRARVARGPLNPREAVHIVLGVCAGLGRAHRAGILHRDVKPANIVVTTDGEVKVLDFGIAKLAGDAGLTRPGAVVGTLSYLAPEQLLGDPVDARSDLWSVAVLLYELLTGTLPFRGDREGAVVRAILDLEPDLEPIRNVAGDALARLLERGLAKEPSRRPQDLTELAMQLQSLLGFLGESAGGPAVMAPTLAFPTPSRRRIESRAEARIDPGRSDERSMSSTSGRFGASGFGLVAREAELTSLATLIEEVLEEGVRFAFVCGEAGRGKSTLVQHFCRRLEADSPFLAVFGSCNASSGGGDPYLPFREILAKLAGEVGRDDRSDTQSTYDGESLLPELVSALVEQAPGLVGTFLNGPELLGRARRSGLSASLLGPLAGLVESDGGRADLDRHELLEQYSRVLQRVAGRRPLVLVLEDLHWTDSGSAALLGHLAMALEAAPVLVLGTYRREEIALVQGERHPLEPVLNELARRHGEIEIDLDATDPRSFVDALLDAEPNTFDSAFRGRLAERTSGLPLFATELLRGLRASKAVVRDDEGRWGLARKVDWDQVPRRVEAVVAERVSRLPESLLATLTVAAVEGEEFTAEVVAAVLGRDSREVARELSQDAARRHRMVHATGVRRIGAQRLSHYRFRHGLFARFLSDAMDAVERAVAHEDIALELERLWSEQLEEVSPRLAHHFLAAGITDRAIVALRAAGARASQLSEHAAAIGHWRRALAELAKTPAGSARDTTEFELQTALARSLTAMHGFTAPEVEAAYRRARDLCSGLATLPEFPVLWGLFAFSAVRGELAQALELAVSLRARAEGDPILTLQADYAVGATTLLLGDLTTASRHLEAASRRGPDQEGQQLREQFGQDNRKVALSYLALQRGLAGDGRAPATCREASSWIAEDPHPFTDSTVRLLLGLTQGIAGSFDEVAEHGRHIVELAERFGLFQAREGALLEAWALVARRPATGRKRLAEAIESYRASGWSVFLPFWLVTLARAEIDSGDASGAEQRLAEAGRLAERTGESWWKAEQLRLEAETLREGDLVAARERLCEAVALAERQGARALAIRAGEDLDQLAD